MTKAIIFDLDGLLIDSEIISYKIYKEILKKYGHKYSVEEYAANYSGKTEVKNVTRLIADYGLPLTFEQVFAQVQEIEQQLIREGVNLKPGAKELLACLKENHYKTAIATSSKKERALTILKQHNVVECFDQFVFAEDISRSKPDPDVFLKACSKLVENPESCLVLEDSEAGIQAAHAANIPVICIPDMKVPSANYLEMTEAILKSLDEVINYLKNK